MLSWTMHAPQLLAGRSTTALFHAPRVKDRHSVLAFQPNGGLLMTVDTAAIEE